MCSVSAEPPLLLVAIRTESPLVAAIDARGAFAVNVLSDRPGRDRRGVRRPRCCAATRSHVRDWWPLAADAVPLLHGAAARFTLPRRATHASPAPTRSSSAPSPRAERGSATPLAYTRRGYVAPLATERLAA